MEKIKNTLGILFLLLIAYWVISAAWGVINMQVCSYDLAKNATCEQIARNNANNCTYLILRWKKVDYSKELAECKDWEAKQQK